jgi:hypothetical protein
MIPEKGDYQRRHLSSIPLPVAVDRSQRAAYKAPEGQDATINKLKKRIETLEREAEELQDDIKTMYAVSESVFHPFTTSRCRECLHGIVSSCFGITKTWRPKIQSSSQHNTCLMRSRRSFLGDVLTHALAPSGLPCVELRQAHAPQAFLSSFSAHRFQHSYSLPNNTRWRRQSKQSSGPSRYLGLSLHATASDRLTKFIHAQ